MIIKIFKSNNPVAAFLAPIVTAIFWFTGYLFADSTISSPDFGFYFYKIINEYFAAHRLFEVFIGIFLVSAQAIILNRIFNQNDFYERNIFLPSLLYIVLMSSAPNSYFVTPLLVANTFLIIGFSYIYKLRRQIDAKSTIFKTAFYLGIASCFYPPYTLYIITVFVALLIIRPFVMREYIISLVGFFIPWCYLLSFTYINKGGIYLEFINELQFNNSISLKYFESNVYIKTLLISFLGIILLHGFFTWMQSLQMSSLRFKRLNQLNISFFILGFILSILEIFIIDINFNILVLALPLTLILPFGLTEAKNKTFPSFLWYLFIILILINTCNS